MVKYLIGEESFKTKEDAVKFAVNNNFSTDEIRVEKDSKLCYRCLGEMEKSKVVGMKLYCPNCKRTVSKIRTGVYQ